MNMGEKRLKSWRKTMPCNVYLYDSSYSPLQERRILIYVSCSSQQGLNLGNTVNNAQISGTINIKRGAKLAFNHQAMIYNVTVNDPIGMYSPVYIDNLNGQETGNLDIVMRLKARSGTQTGPLPTTSRAVMAFIDNQAWND